MVILPMVHQYSRMLQRNLLYTAVTRSKEMLILLGEYDSYQRCVQVESHLRLTTLVERIQEVAGYTKEQMNQLDQTEQALYTDEPFEKVKTTRDVPNKDEKKQAPDMPKDSRLTLTAILEQTIDPMIGMEGIRPQDFVSQT